MYTKSSDQLFHEHLDNCTQCDHNPFGLCPRGQMLLEQTVKESADILLEECNKSENSHRQP